MKHGLKALIFSLIFVFGIFNVLSLADTEYSLTVIQNGMRVTTQKAPGTNITLGIKPESGVKGWKVEQGDITINNNSFTMPEKSVVISARYDLDAYTITYNLDGGINNSSNPTTYNEETETITLQAPTKVGYTFTGWTGSNGTTPELTVTIPKGSSGNKEFTANWQINSYTITWKNYDGTVLKTDTLSYGATPVYSESTPTRVSTGQHTYIFNGWSPAITTVTGNATYTAQYSSTENSYTVTATAGTGGTISPTSTTVAYGGSATFTITQNSGYVLSSLKVDGNAVDKALSYTITNVQKDTTITAEFSPISYTLTYNARGGSGAPAQQTWLHGGSVTIASAQPTRSGYTFQGWYTGPGGTGSQVSVGTSYSWTSNMTVYAYWYCAGTVTCYPSEAYSDECPTCNGNPSSFRCGGSNLVTTSTTYVAAMPCNACCDSMGSYATDMETLQYSVTCKADAGWTKHSYTVRRCWKCGNGIISGTDFYFSWSTDIATCVYPDCPTCGSKGIVNTYYCSQHNVYGDRSEGHCVHGCKTEHYY